MLFFKKAFVIIAYFDITLGVGRLSPQKTNKNVQYSLHCSSDPSLQSLKVSQRPDA